MADELKRYINPENPVYFSYAWANAEHPDIEEDVNNLCKLLEENHIYYKRDKDGLCPYRWSIQKSEEEIGEGTAIIVVISERYLKSLHCMNEWNLMLKNGKIWERVFPIVLENAKITVDEVFETFYTFFEERKNKIISKQQRGIPPLKRVETEATNAGFYFEALNAMYQYLSDYNKYNLATLRQNNYAVLIKQLKDALPETASTITIAPPSVTPTDNSAKMFSVSIPDNLLQRDKEADKLFNGIKENHFFNLVGVGGMGKTSLTYLMLERHKKDFNEIAYVVVNNNIKDAIVAELNTALDLDFKDDMDKYQQLVTYLENNFNATQPNLLVLDINEISDDTKDFIKNINKLCPKNWKVLTLSRENLDTSEIMATEDFNKNQDIEFLKKLFLKRAGNRYEGFEKFPELFATTFYNPLLAEQLGFYLSKLPERKSLEAIKEILYADTFKNKNMKGFAVLTNDNRSTVINFLTNLASYDSFDHNEQELLRHFVLWPADFIPYFVIKELLQGVFESDDILADTLSELADRSIFTVKSLEDGSYAYKLHGLLAESLQEQIKIAEQDYFVYLRNIYTIIQYGYYDFIPYADCIGNSMCKYNIVPEKLYGLQNSVGIKFYKTWKTDYAKKLYEKYILFFSDKVEKYPNNSDYKNELAIGYTNLALIQTNLTNDYKSAENNHKESIKIGEQLPKDNYIYQNTLASTYNNLATLQLDKMSDYKSATINYNNAIEIRERLPENNPEYQDDLARVYYNLANLQMTNLNDYESAETNYIKSIEIREKLSKNNPEYQLWLAASYGNLAILQSDHFNDYKSAENNYKKSLYIQERLSNSPVYQDNLALTYYNLANLQRDKLKDYESAETNYNKAITIEETLLDVNRKLFLIRWGKWKYGLAKLYFITNKTNSAKEIMVEIKPLAEECLVEKPNDKFTIETNYCIKNLWQKINGE